MCPLVVGPSGQTMTSHNSSTRSAHGTDSPHSTSSQRKSSRRKASGTGGSSRRGRAMPQRQNRSRSTRAMKWLEPRLLLITTGVTLFGVLLEVVAISTDSWLVMEFRGHASLKADNTTTNPVTEGYMGLWRICKVELVTRTTSDGSTEETSSKLIFFCIALLWLFLLLFFKLFLLLLLFFLIDEVFCCK